MASNNFANSSALSALSTLASKWLNRLAPFFLLLAVIWLCWSIARIVWLVLAPPQAPALPELPRQINTSAQSSQKANFNIFARPIASPAQPSVNTPPANILLKGVMTASPMSSSSALLDVNSQIKNYRVGTQLDDSNYTLLEVQWNEVTLEDDRGQTINITMTQPMELNQMFVAKGSSSGQRSRNTHNASRATNSSNTSNRQSNNSSNNRLKNNQNPSATTSNQNNNSANTSNNDTAKNAASKAINTAVMELKTNPAGYLSRMGVMATGEGYQVTGAMPANIRSKVGLEIGDKVLTVNGQSVGSNPVGDADLLKKVEKSGQAQIQVQRGEQIITIRQQF